MTLKITKAGKNTVEHSVFQAQRLIMEEDYFKMDFRERRRFQRRLLDNPLRYRVSEEKLFEDTHTIDASEGGLMFTSKKDVKKGSIINLQMPIDGREYEIKARVARVVFDESIGQYRVGVEFTDYTESFRISLKLKLVNVLIATTIFSSVFLGGTSKAVAGETVPGTIFQTSLSNGLTGKRSSGMDLSETSLRKLVESGYSYVTIPVVRFMNNHNSTDLITSRNVPGDREIIKGIKRAHKLGLKVLLKPRIDIINNFDGAYSSADIGFSSEDDWSKWFTEYRKYINHYARIAQKNKVEIFCVGTELSFTTQRDDKWIDLIQLTRGVYGGKLVYAARDNNLSRITFWNQLDYIGIEAGKPSSENIPSIEDMKLIWDKWHDTISAIQMTLNKPVILTNWMI